MATFSEFISSLDQDVGKRGKQFEHFVKWFLLNDPEWSTQVDQIWLWEEYPERWGADCGIDLVFRHKGGEVWAVQAKCYSQQHDITKHDVDKFLSESNRKGIDKRLLVATTDRIGGNAKQVCEAQEKKVFRYLLSNFETANIEYPASIGDLHSAKRKPKPAPREHQLEAIEGVVSGFERGDRGQLIMACGTGKTFTTLWIKERLEASSTLILLPSLGLLSQTLHEWTLAANLPFDVLCVCSDGSVGKKGADEAIHSITDVAFPVTSDVDEIRRFLCRDGMKVVFSTYQSSPLVAEAQSVSTVPDFQLAIADEAHRCAGKVGNDFTTILDAKRIRARKRLFATATPRTYSTNVKKAAGERGIDVVGMDDEAVFGSVSYSLPFGEAIKRGLLTDYQVVIVGVDNPTIAAWIENRELLKTDSGIESDAESLATQIGLLKAYKDYDLHRVISFHSRVKRAEQFSKDLIDVAGWVGDQHKPSGLMKADYVSGEMPTDKRRIKLSQLKSLAPGERGLLTNARCLSEGVDVPSLDGVAFIDPRSSQIDIIQAVGRAIRLSKDKTTGTIILPVFIESGVDAANSIEASNFKPIWEVLNALKAHDDVLVAELDQLRTEMGRKGGSMVDLDAFSKIHIDLPASIDQGFGEALRTYLVERVTESWEYGYGALQNFSIQFGNCLVPDQFKLADGYNLGTWVGTQRSKRDTMSPERRTRLEALKGWIWDVPEQAWEHGYARLLEYSEKNGNCLVPVEFKTPDDYKIGRWTRHMRASRDKLLPERKARLEALKGWAWDLFAEAWEIGYAHLVQYSETNGNCLVPSTFKTPDGYKLGNWVTSQRSKRKMMPPERQKRLEALSGWVWDPVDEAWEKGCVCLGQYSETNGNCLVPDQFKLADGYNLGTWVGTQRSKRDTMSPERRTRLEALKGWIWDPVDEAWQDGYARLAQYSEAHGNCLVRQDFKLADGYKLGSWIGRQRSARDKMSPERRTRLEALKGWSWDMLEEAWEIGYVHLVQYSETNGNCLVPVEFKTPDDYKLGSWINTQRTTRDKMSPERRTRLEALKGWSWDMLEEAWEIGYAHLVQYSETNGNCLVPVEFKTPDDYKLGKWLNQQRTKRDKMSPERKARLEALKGWIWDALKGAWEERYAQLVLYSEAKGNCVVPSTFKTPDGYDLARWIRFQRTRRDKMPSERQTRLDALPGWFWGGGQNK